MSSFNLSYVLYLDLNNNNGNNEPVIFLPAMLLRCLGWSEGNRTKENLLIQLIFILGAVSKSISS